MGSKKSDKARKRAQYDKEPVWRSVERDGRARTYHRPEVTLYFFFQAENGILDTSVTRVQTCALPIWSVCSRGSTFRSSKELLDLSRTSGLRLKEIGRASCRESEKIFVVAASLKK